MTTQVDNVQHLGDYNENVTSPTIQNVTANITIIPTIQMTTSADNITTLDYDVTTIGVISQNVTTAADDDNTSWYLVTSCGNTSCDLFATTASDDVNVTTGDFLKGYPYPSFYSWQHIVLSSLVVTLIMLVIVLGNTLVIVAVAKDRNLKGLQNWFITSLAVSDLFVGLFIMPFSLANELMGYWVFGNIVCELWLAVDVLLCTASILNLCLISLDRYWSVTRAVSYVKTRTKKRAIIMITIVWIMSMIICLPPLAGWKRPQPVKFDLYPQYPLCVLSEEPGYVVYSTMGSFYIPLVVMVMVYFKIYLAARSRARRNLKKPTPKNMPMNGKSTSTSTTTTSFSNPSALAVRTQQLSPTKEFSSEDEEEDDPSGHSVTGGKINLGMPHTPESAEPPGQHFGKITLSVTQHGSDSGGMVSGDEKKNLLSAGEETDTTIVTHTVGGSPNSGDKEQQQQQRHIHFTDDTDSHSDYARPNLPDYPRKEPVSSGGEENLKPLLQQESDSQRDSDTRSPHLYTATTSNGHSPSKSPNCSPNTNETTATKLPHSPSLQLPVPSPTGRHGRSGSFFRRKAKENSPKPTRDDPERFKRRIARAKERRATLVLGIIMITFIGCWLPFFSIYLVTSLAKLPFPPMVFAVIFWLGYVNSALNPIIYTIFNRDFRHAFKRILIGRRNTF